MIKRKIFGRNSYLGHRPPDPELKKRGKACDAFALFGAMIAWDALSGFFIVFINIFLDCFIKIS